MIRLVRAQDGKDVWVAPGEVLVVEARNDEWLDLPSCVVAFEGGRFVEVCGEPRAVVRALSGEDVEFPTSEEVLAARKAASDRWRAQQMELKARVDAYRASAPRPSLLARLWGAA